MYIRNEVNFNITYKNYKLEGWNVVHLVGCLPGMQNTLGSIPSTTHIRLRLWHKPVIPAFGGEGWRARCSMSSSAVSNLKPTLEA